VDWGSSIVWATTFFYPHLLYLDTWIRMLCTVDRSVTMKHKRSVIKCNINVQTPISAYRDLIGPIYRQLFLYLLCTQSWFVFLYSYACFYKGNNREFDVVSIGNVNLPNGLFYSLREYITRISQNCTLVFM